MTVHYTGHGVTLHHGDCLDILRTLPDASVDAVVTDPPYGIEFMGKSWDSFSEDAVSRSWDTKGRTMTSAPREVGKPKTHIADNPRCRKCGRTINGRDTAKGFKVCHCDQPDIYAPNTSARKFQAWSESWAAECLRVMRPGGHLLAFGGTRTWHRLACAIEDAGFEVRDSIAWMYGSGFPKSLDVSKAIDRAAGAEREVVGADPEARRRNKATPRFTGDQYANGDEWQGAPAVMLTAPATAEAAQWAGWGTAMKPAHEPIVVARKPLAGTVAANVLAHGTGALNIDSCRIEGAFKSGWAESGSKASDNDSMSGPNYARDPKPDNPAGRWPANVVLDEHAAAALDAQSGELSCNPPATWRRDKANLDPSSWALPEKGAGEIRTGFGDTGGASRFFKVIATTQEDDFPCCTNAKSAPNATAPAEAIVTGSADAMTETMARGSRFIYTAKADAAERPAVDGVRHPTVKPLDLMRWLVRLVTPPGGVVLEPFAGSGTTVEACLLEGFRCIAVEREADYLPLIVARITRQRDPVAHVRLVGDPEPTLFDEDAS